MKYAKINTHDIANGPGIRVSLFVSGCRRKCPGCFNEEAQDFNYGQPFTEETIKEILKALDNPWINGLTILGGEPFEEENVYEVMKLINRVVARFKYEKTIWLYTGYTVEEIISKTRTDLRKQCILSDIDVLVDGPFIQELKDISLKFRGSSNQRIIDMPNTRRDGEVVLAEV